MGSWGSLGLSAMKLRSPTSLASRRRECGSATFIVFALLSAMAVFIIANTIALHRLERELRLVEKQQLKQYPTGTNWPPAGGTQTRRGIP